MMGRFIFRWYLLVTPSKSKSKQKLFETLAIDDGRFSRLCVICFSVHVHEIAALNKLHKSFLESDKGSCISITVLALCQSSRWEDLVVGAPQFYEKDGSAGGAVYIYINKGGKDWENIVPVQLTGNKESMFGLAVENIGDLNQDGYGGKK